MAIDGIKTGLDTTTLAQDTHGVRLPAPSSTAGEPVNQTTAPQADRVSLTNEATLLHSVEKRLSSLPVVDTAKVDRLRGEIAQGRFSIDPARVAEKMIAFEAQLSKKGE